MATVDPFKKNPWKPAKPPAVDMPQTPGLMGQNNKGPAIQPPQSKTPGPAAPGLMGLSPDKLARVAAQRQSNMQRDAEKDRLARQYGAADRQSTIGGSSQSMNMLSEAYQARSNAGQFKGSFDQYVQQELAKDQRTPAAHPLAKTAATQTSTADPSRPAREPAPVRGPAPSPGMNARMGPAPGGQPNSGGLPYDRPQNPGQTTGPEPAPQDPNQRVNAYRPFPGTTIDAGQVPGSTDGISYDSTNDYYNALQSGLGSRYQDEFGNGIGGNSVGNDGSWNVPEFMRNLSGRYSEANTDPTTRQVQSDETVQGRLGGLMRENNELNQIAMDRAREEASARGMLGSSVAEGAALRASREAMLPIAQQDAAWYGQTSRDNMDATNQDALADQQGRLGLLGQEVGTAANLLDSATNRRHQTAERLTDRSWQSWENELGYRRGSLDREDQQQWNSRESGINRNFDRETREDNQDWQSTEAGRNREFERTTQLINNRFQGDEAARDRALRGAETYFNMTFGREGMLSQQLSAIYGNPNLTPEQQQAAAANARASAQDLWESFNATFAAGVPRIFADPYGIPSQQQPPPGRAAPPVVGGDPGTTPPPGTAPVNPPPVTTPETGPIPPEPPHPGPRPPGTIRGGRAWEQAMADWQAWQRQYGGGG